MKHKSTILVPAVSARLPPRAVLVRPQRSAGQTFSPVSDPGVERRATNSRLKLHSPSFVEIFGQFYIHRLMEGASSIHSFPPIYGEVTVGKTPLTAG